MHSLLKSDEEMNELHGKNYLDKLKRDIKKKRISSTCKVEYIYNNTYRSPKYSKLIIKKLKHLIFFEQNYYSSNKQNFFNRFNSAHVNHLQLYLYLYSFCDSDKDLIVGLRILGKLLRTININKLTLKLGMSLWVIMEINIPDQIFFF